MQDDRLETYVRRGRTRVAGWLSRCDAEMFRVLLTCQSAAGLAGSVVEIGVHQGKSFILLALANAGQDCYAIDVFDAQHLNLDASGAGDKARFLANLARFGLDPGAIAIDARPSQAVTAEDIRARVGAARFFHVDGAHHVDAVLHDLALAEASLGDGGILAVDDVFRPEWPDVSLGLFSHIARGETRLVPFAIGFNKTFLCRAAHADRYRAALRESALLRLYFTKSYRVAREEILVFQAYPLPEWRLRTRAAFYLKLYHPDLALILQQWRILR
ncbi:class I SAM-dependent methyltransferase [Aquabacter spiritensis]|uniref:Methyltransferase family protein n=1 Tax=Aquabacter spiritensis TaxID=933073 RepID=A0A4V2UY56_9HYPH|nr:class I SAM-dependent methyltransferase [Aquabacter spiritensis]TCT06068.1 methyltransferase family protein [Aquabacter spiritensis]